MWKLYEDLIQERIHQTAAFCAQSHAHIFCALKVYILLILHPSPSASKGRASFGYLIY